MVHFPHKALTSTCNPFPCDRSKGLPVVFPDKGSGKESQSMGAEGGRINGSRETPWLVVKDLTLGAGAKSTEPEERLLRSGITAVFLVQRTG